LFTKKEFGNILGYFFVGETNLLNYIPSWKFFLPRNRFKNGSPIISYQVGLPDTLAEIHGSELVSVNKPKIRIWTGGLKMNDFSRKKVPPQFFFSLSGNPLAINAFLPRLRWNTDFFQYNSSVRS
jgi:hypothetical protein